MSIELCRNVGEISKMLLDNWSDARMHWARMLVEATETGTDALWNEATTKNPDERNLE